MLSFLSLLTVVLLRSAISLRVSPLLTDVVRFFVVLLRVLRLLLVFLLERLLREEETREDPSERSDETRTAGAALASTPTVERRVRSSLAR